MWKKASCPEPAPEPVPEPDPEPEPEPEPMPEPAELILADMSLREKVCQMFIIFPEAITGVHAAFSFVHGRSSVYFTIRTAFFSPI